MLQRVVNTLEALDASTSGLRVITGADFDARGRCLSPTARAFLAADLIDGRAAYQQLLLRHALLLTGASLSYVQTVQALSPADRAAIEAGEMTLSFARRCQPNVISA